MELHHTWLDARVFDTVDLDFKGMARLALTNKTWSEVMIGKMDKLLYHQISSKIPFVQPDGSMTLDSDQTIHFNELHIVPGRLLKALGVLEKLIVTKRCPRDFNDLFDNKLFAARRPAGADNSDEVMDTLNTAHFLLLLAKHLSNGNQFVQISVFAILLGYIASAQCSTALFGQSKRLTEALHGYTTDALEYCSTRPIHKSLKSNLEQHGAAVVKLLKSDDV